MRRRNCSRAAAKSLGRWRRLPPRWQSAKKESAASNEKGAALVKENEDLRAECSRLDSLIQSKSEEIAKLSSQAVVLQQGLARAKDEIALNNARPVNGADNAKDKDTIAQLSKLLESAQREAEKLKRQLQEKEELMLNLKVSTQVPQEEYAKVKEKLEAAEKVLRTIHGAG